MLFSLVLTVYIGFKADKLPDFGVVESENVLIEATGIFEGITSAEGMGPPASWVLVCTNGLWAKATTHLPATLM